MSSKKMSLDGIVYVVRLFEISIDDTTIKDDGDIMWPTLGGNEKLPPADGALVLYDVTDRGSIVEIPDILRKLGSADIHY